MRKAKYMTIVDPPAGIPGGEVAIEISGARGNAPARAWFGGVEAHTVASSSNRALVLVPEVNRRTAVAVTTAEHQDVESAEFIAGRLLLDEVHPVTNPAFDPTDGSLMTTRSGSRGERVPVSLFRVDPDGKIEDFSGDITNPTSIAFDSRGRMFVTSRLDGAVYRVTELKEVVLFADELGIATGLAFGPDGTMFVGDRTGTIYRINEIGEAKAWAELEPSVSAYHLAFGPDGGLYVAGPTVSTFDAITRFDEDGNPRIFYQGLGRPQGLAFDREGNLYLAASLRGRRGIARITPDGNEAKLVVAGMNLVGLAFSPRGEMVVATNRSLYSLPLGIYGALLG